MLRPYRYAQAPMAARISHGMSVHRDLAIECLRGFGFWLPGLLRGQAQAPVAGGKCLKAPG